MTFDIVGIEVRHASVRRVSCCRSVQTWSMSLQDLSAGFTCRQFVILQESLQTAGPSGPVPEKKTSRRKKRTSRGGAWRAYVHHTCQGGPKPTSDTLREKAREYQEMKAAGGETWQFYQNLGHLGTMAGRQGHKAYGRHVIPDSSSASTSWAMVPSHANELETALARIRHEARSHQQLVQYEAQIQQSNQLENSRKALGELAHATGLTPESVFSEDIALWSHLACPHAGVVYPSSIQFVAPAGAVAIDACAQTI